MIFNSSEGCHESQEGDKLLYHWVRDATNFRVSLTEQVDDICLCDASVNFSNRLNCDIRAKFVNQSPSNSGNTTRVPSQEDNNNENDGERRGITLNFENTVVLASKVEHESSIWIALHVSAPISSIENKDTSAQPLVQRSFADPSTIPIDAAKRVVDNIYKRFCLLNGTFKMIANRVSEINPSLTIGSEELRKLIREETRSICEQYFTETLPAIHLHSYIYNVAALYNYILYLDISPISLMKVNSFINHVIGIDPTKIRHSIVIFNDHLLWSSLNMEDTCTVYNYLISVPIKGALQEELVKEVDKVRRIKEDMPIYLTECSLISDKTGDYSDDNPPSSDRMTKVALGKLYLTLFRSSNDMTLGLFLTESNLTDLLMNCELFLTRDTRLGVIPLASLAQLVGQSFLKTNSQPTSVTTSSIAGKSTIDVSLGPNSLASRKKSPADNIVAKANILSGQKYVMIDRIDSSVTWPTKLEIQRRGHSTIAQPPSVGSSSKWQRLVRWLIELEPDFHQLRCLTGGKLEEFLGKLQSDCWVMIINSQYRTVYSINKIKNSGLTEAQQSAIQLERALSRSNCWI